jgi:alpha-D-glucose phosphate-specific phosphoglucomutase
MPGTAIQFGTSGWRALIADAFTFENVRLATAAIAGHVRSKNPRPVLIVGHDTRFFSEEFALAAAQVLHDQGVRVLLCDGPTPTPVLACEIQRRGLDGGVNFTASHNPAEYQGLKFSDRHGGPAPPEATRDIEARAAKLAAGGPLPVPEGQPDSFELVRPQEDYFRRLGELVRFSLIREAGLKVVCDPLYGAGAGYLDRALAQNGIEAAAIRTHRDVLFGGHGPDVSEENLAALGQEVTRRGAQVGLATDGDADRFGIVDSNGRFVSPNHILALLYDYLVETRGWKLGVARSVATTHLVDAVARMHGQPVYETPVGFKYIGAHIAADRIALGGEESAGLSIRGHVPEKDGILACLLTAEMTAARGQSLREQLQALFRRIGGEYWPIRVNLHLPDDIKQRAVTRLKEKYTEFVGRPVRKEDRTDGLKLVLDDGAWVLMRLSGTEPLLRLYVEASSPDAARRLAEDVRQWVLA